MKSLPTPSSKPQRLFDASWSLAYAIYWLATATPGELTHALSNREIPERPNDHLDVLSLGAESPSSAFRQQVLAAIVSVTTEMSRSATFPMLVWMRAQVSGGVSLRREVLRALAEWRLGLPSHVLPIMTNGAIDERLESSLALSFSASQVALRSGRPLEEFLFAPRSDDDPPLESEWTLRFVDTRPPRSPRTLDERTGAKLMSTLDGIFRRLAEDLPSPLHAIMGTLVAGSNPPRFATRTPIREIVDALKHHFPELADYQHLSIGRGLTRYIDSPLGRRPGTTAGGRTGKAPATRRPRSNFGKKRER